MNLSRKNKLILIAGITSIILGYLSFSYIMRPPKAIENRIVDYTGTSSDLLNKVKETPLEWQNKIVVISGIIDYTDSLGLMFSSGVYCQLKENYNHQFIDIKKPIKLKGRVIGYDDLMNELKLDQCTIQ